MNIIFMRHGEATDNVKELISDKEVYFFTLTDSGRNTVFESLKRLPDNVDKVYVSPMPRTIQTANIVRVKYPNVEYIIDNRLREIDHGKYSGQKNNEDLDRTRECQVAGDYFIRFGQYGENKYDIEKRLSDFLDDVRTKNFTNNTIMIVSHGSITSFMKRLLGLKSPHIKTGKAEEFTDIDFGALDNSIAKLERVRRDSRRNRLNIVRSSRLDQNIEAVYRKVARDNFNDIELNDTVLARLMRGAAGDDLIRVSSTPFDNGPIVVSLLDNVASFIDKWMKHYIDLGVKNFALVNCGSKDDTFDKVTKYVGHVNIDIWKANCVYNCTWACGARQYLMAKYGIGRWYLNVDSDELFVYKGYESTSLLDFANSSEGCLVSSMMVDVYKKGGIAELGTIDDYHYIDKNTYRTSENKPYGIRIYGGPRCRTFGIRPSLQKYPLVYYSGKEMMVNDHFYYPYSLNSAMPIKSYLLHYKFLPDDIIRYRRFADSGIHWNSSSEYKRYIECIDKNPKLSFYNDAISVDLNSVKSNYHDDN